MRILVYPHDMAMGGSQLNAIELGRAMADRGHEVSVYGRPGELLGRVTELGLPFIESPRPSRRPSRSVVRHLAGLVTPGGFDVVHAYEWPPGLEGHLAIRRAPAVAVTTVMSMAVAPFLPRTMPILVGTEQIAAAERRAGRPRVHVTEPPVDLAWNAAQNTPGVEEFRRRWLEDDRPTIVIVSRLVPELKLEGLLTAVDAVGLVARTRPVRLLVVGDGPARDLLKVQARRVNEQAGAGTVILTGAILDPRPAYALADISIGMGGSALRALAYETPLIVQGEKGFFRLLDEDTLSEFLWAGWYGVGGSDRPVEDLAQTLSDLLGDDAARRRLGRFGGDVVRARFSIAAAAVRHERIFEEMLASRPSAAPLVAVDDVRAGVKFGRRVVQRRARRLIGTVARDDFNADPVAASGLTAVGRRGVADPDPGAWIWHPGVAWNDVAGTDRRLVESLAQHRAVIWVDPPLSPRHWHRRRAPATPDGVIVVQPRAAFGPDRPVMRQLTRRLVEMATASALRASGLRPEAVMVTSPYRRLPAESATPRFYYETDDYVAGAALLGVDGPALQQMRTFNVRHADAVLAITPELLETLGAEDRGHVLPNGVVAEFFATDASEMVKPDREGTVVAGLFGQLNDRIDFDLLDAIADAGIELRIVGPLVGRATCAPARLEALCAKPGVRWLGPRPFAELPDLMSQVDVGLTPYTTSEFNRASQPLKTLEYLAAGLPVVSTDLPSARRLNSPDVFLATDDAGFVHGVRMAAQESADPLTIARRRAFAQAHNWNARASQLLGILATLDHRAAPPD